VDGHRNALYIELILENTLFSFVTWHNKANASVWVCCVQNDEVWLGV